ncbi:MAG: hypothetical protein KR126chlam6_00092 [Candidatus Anoxychlamydiales bacterium]|nr:hypothetical protein [Candidatus Anoxychlamydiales bacterium]
MCYNITITNHKCGYMTATRTPDSTTPTNSSGANSARSTPNKADASANKINSWAVNSWAVVGTVFLAIGIVASSIAGLGLNHILIQASIHTLDFALGAGVISTAVAIISFFIAYMGSNSNDTRSNTQNNSSTATPSASSPGKPSADPKAPGRSDAPRGGSSARGTPAPPDIHNEVIGIQNAQNDKGLNNCALNALLQILLNCEKIKLRLKKIKPFEIFIQAYDSFKKGNEITAQDIRKYLADRKIMQEGAEPEDVNAILEFILEQLRYEEDMKNTLITTNYFATQKEALERGNTAEDNNGIITLPPNLSNGDLKTRLSDYFYSHQNNPSTAGAPRLHFLEERTLAFAPENLFFHIQRTYAEPFALIQQLPLNLHLETKYFENKQSKDYALKGFVVHVPGHYYSYVKKANKWYKCDGPSVEGVSEASALEATTKAHVAHYENKA